MTTATQPLAGAARFVPVPVAEPWIEPPEEITWTGRTVGGRYWRGLLSPHLLSP